MVCSRHKQGVHRTGASSFLAMNGYDLTESDDRLYAAMIALSSSKTLDRWGSPRYSRVVLSTCWTSRSSRLSASPGERDAHDQIVSAEQPDAELLDCALLDQRGIRRLVVSFHENEGQADEG
jgi:hypothetical protein